MDFTNNLRQILWDRIGEGKTFPNRKRMADALGIDPSQLNRFIEGERGLSVDTLGRVLDGLGARLVLPGEAPPEVAREVCFVSARPTGTVGDPAPPASEDYFAVPLATEPVAAGPGRIPQDDIRGWVLVWRHHESVRFRSDLVAVSIGKGEVSMVPTLHPGDIVLVDRGEKAPDPPGKIMLVCEPDGGCAVKRVSTRPVDGDLELVFYSDNSRDYPPRVFRLNRDYGGELSAAIGGRVVWAWSDMTRK
ncbi:Peptidase S24-like [Humidesulfovibrio mexicanus]|uniref:Peptidase S24-like n=1 Tax=Humidesulfovibrio mexicanus TaxID=147047 RepID=A0A239CA19_9BACT|nr:LexA family transcriptional regulator [Humidesulfovibrio mexicanus]SNS17067.1 Peptidase S24-like [Humidesulfovibrio mexicanus]